MINLESTTTNVSEKSLQFLTVSDTMGFIKGPGKRGYIVVDTLLPTQMFARARNI